MGSQRFGHNLVTKQQEEEARIRQVEAVMTGLPALDRIYRCTGSPEIWVLVLIT